MAQAVQFVQFSSADPTQQEGGTRGRFHGWLCCKAAWKTRNSLLPSHRHQPMDRETRASRDLGKKHRNQPYILCMSLQKDFPPLRAVGTAVNSEAPSACPWLGFERFSCAFPVTGSATSCCSSDRRRHSDIGSVTGWVFAASNPADPPMQVDRRQRHQVRDK
ncbi:hypothetical protein VTK56DRAFT_8069 [Thermocarpiscus australiensis]